MKYELKEAVIEGYEAYSDPDDRSKTMTYGTGQPVEFVKARVQGEVRYRQLTLHRDINGDRPAVGSTCTIEVEDVLEADARLNRNGEPYATYKSKVRAVGFKVTTPAAKAA